ncbi:hypothetical protein [Moritella viscosa]|uniref:ATPase subunit of terminase (GpP-like) n=1 Tax=Moritella viscosa TaxID=80854 RepID=A0A1L0C662_9GAMM|nr:hypothetical protein [Moritella viscosa]SGZ02307.1 Putative ATPase subunit of terminase (GpP-like) [Moritella viscosa]SGZ15300.1 Putative ATPase subunit of terminase (GpP-like) [Moritella viscosa]SGZ16155.1 Putative ATPase subunit of terminase (GpP-like) [Moritella viscosa]SHO28098.1 Putative ATPase subunit of terminase (GpP-like) [Moritella viscosa]
MQKLKVIVERCEGISCSLYGYDEMFINVSKDANSDDFVKSLIRFTLEEAISTGDNQIFLFSSPDYREKFKKQMLDFACSLDEEVDSLGFLSNGAQISFILASSRTSSGAVGHSYAVDCFDDIVPTDVYNLMLGWTMFVGLRAVFISTSST